ncbi:hypothetical protein MKZ17_04335 [Solibacillus sp. FSL R7-0682]|jgi:hypothetical protein|uniref:hypothetical protein n=1 Tax=Solibacillus sp. FSL R7-0682 TaxID=2921690 RepID=UPI0030FCBF24
MQCGAKCFIVEVEQDGLTKRIPVKARSPILARKTVRMLFEDAVEIVFVKEDSANKSDED